MFYVYVLESLKTGEYYTGQTSNLEKRFDQHNGGLSRATKHAVPWKIVFTEKFKTRSEAIRRECYLKRLKSRKAIKKLIGV
ncbi:MAG: GIY-YIG nuclease family protein [Ignavibacteria bacterium]|nr:GIY-YIG nuclease family protein [Ignavibacteria bacterium]